VTPPRDQTPTPEETIAARLRMLFCRYCDVPHSHPDADIFMEQAMPILRAQREAGRMCARCGQHEAKFCLSCEDYFDDQA
jgi:uncharacterized Zn-finger protein